MIFRLYLNLLKNFSEVGRDSDCLLYTSDAADE